MSNKKSFFERSQWFLTVEDLYKKRLDYLVSFARRHVYQSDSSIDVVHDAIVKSIEYFNKPQNKGRKVYIRNIEYQILRLARKHNKYSSIQKTCGLMGINGDNDADD